MDSQGRPVKPSPVPPLAPPGQLQARVEAALAARGQPLHSPSSSDDGHGSGPDNGESSSHHAPSSGSKLRGQRGQAPPAAGCMRQRHGVFATLIGRLFGSRHKHKRVRFAPAASNGSAPSAHPPSDTQASQAEPISTAADGSPAAAGSLALQQASADARQCTHPSLAPSASAAPPAISGPTNKAQLVLLDFGLAEELSPKVRQHFISFLFHICSGNSRAAAQHLLKWGSHQGCQDKASFFEDMEEMFR